MKFDKAPDTPVTESMRQAMGVIINWQNEQYRKFGLWKNWPLYNIAFQRRRFEAGQISESEFHELREMFLKARGT